MNRRSILTMNYDNTLNCQTNKIQTCQLNARINPVIQLK